MPRSTRPTPRPTPCRESFRGTCKDVRRAAVTFRRAWWANSLDCEHDAVNLRNIDKIEAFERWADGEDGGEVAGLVDTVRVRLDHCGFEDAGVMALYPMPPVLARFAHTFINLEHLEYTSEAVVVDCAWMEPLVSLRTLVVGADDCVVLG